MSEMRQVCHCENCGSEADMIVTCEWVEVEKEPGVVSRKKKETRTCTVCGNEADIIVETDE
ncbi:MAG: hypothetical protein SWC40_02500 [Thermodesulfobacteriota bacterium]|nr:hypothetical protein [Thermodesulfobacteriota bacterium]